MNNYPKVSTDDAAKEVERLHNGIEEKLKTSVSDAVRIGEILTTIKEKIGHGQYEKWVKENVNFNTVTAWRYMKLYSYGKSLTAKDLPEAYKQMETFEAQEKQSEYKKAMIRVCEYKKTGKKPEGWRKNTDDKLYTEEIEREKRINEAAQKGEKYKKEFEEKQDREKISRDERNSRLDGFMDTLKNGIEKEKEKIEFVKKIGLSGNNASHGFNEILINYLQTLHNDSECIEACHNIIKICKGFVNDLQKKSVGK